MARYHCQRCSAEEFTTNPPHLCRDIRKRLARQEKALKIIEDIIRDDGLDTYSKAESIIKALSGRDLGT